jgi:hypothetical protein
LRPAAGLGLVRALLACTAVAEPEAPDGGRPDASDAAVDRPEPDAVTRCPDDRFGPGDLERPAAALNPGRHALVLCDGRADVFALESAPGERWTLELSGSMALVATIIEPSGSTRRLIRTEPGAIGRGAFDVATGNERVRIESLEAVAGPVGYVLGLAVETGDCPAEGQVVGAGEGCLSDTLRMPAEALAAGDSVTRCVSLPDNGQLLLTARCGATAAWVSARVGPGPAVCRTLGPVAAPAGDCAFELSAAAPGPVRWLRAPGDGDTRFVAGETQRWVGRLAFGAPAGLSPPAEPVWRGEVRARLGNGAVTGLGVVETHAPEFAVTGFRPEGETTELVLTAAARVADVDIIVSPGGAGSEPWSTPLASADVGDPRFDAPLPVDAGAEPAFAALYAVGVLSHHFEAVSAVLAGLPAGSGAVPVPRVHVRWSPARAEACGTCFSPGDLPVIELSDRPGDPDIWDDAVLLHELGHWFAAGYGRDDSPGGAHDGSRAAPVIAWSEGFADAFAAWRLGSPRLLDRRADGPRLRDLEEMSETDPLARGTADGRLDGLVSERLVGALLWDLTDSAADGDDAVAFPMEAVIAAALPGARRWGFDRGAPGFDLVDFLDVLACVEPAAGEAGAQLAQARGVPYDGPPEASACATLSSGG